MSYCRPKFGQPVIKYTDKATLDAFLIRNGGSGARYEDSKAHIVTRIKGKDCVVWAVPGSWVRCWEPGQFGVIPSKVFDQEYEVVNH